MATIMLRSHGARFPGLCLSGRCALAGILLSWLAACTYQGGFNPTYLPDDPPDYIGSGVAQLVMSEEAENAVHSGGPESFTGGATTLNIPLGFILRSVSEEVLQDRFSGGTQFANRLPAASTAQLILMPSIVRFEYWYNSARNVGFAITPQVEVDLQVVLLDESGNEILNATYESGRVSGDTYFASGSPGEKVNQTLHRVLYELLVKAFDDARPALTERVSRLQDVSAGARSG